MNNINSIVMKVGLIYCKKYTHGVLKNWLLFPWIQNGRKSSNAEFSTQKSINDGNNFVTVKLHENYYNVYLTGAVSVPICVFITVDLFFNAAVLGKINMSGDWCTFFNILPI